MTKHIDDIIGYINQEIASGNEPKSYAYCPEAIQIEKSKREIIISNDNQDAKNTLIIASNYSPDKFTCQFQDIIYKGDKRSNKRGLVFGIHNLINVNEDISFVNFKGEHQTLKKGDKIRLFTTKTCAKELVICSANGISAEYFYKTYRPRDKNGVLLEPPAQAIIAYTCNSR